MIKRQAVRAVCAANEEIAARDRDPEVTSCTKARHSLEYIRFDHQDQSNSTHLITHPHTANDIAGLRHHLSPSFSPHHLNSLRKIMAFKAPIRSRQATKSPSRQKHFAANNMFFDAVPKGNGSC